MPALPADIAAASRDVVAADWSSATIAARYPSARDGTVDAAKGYFDSIADAQVVADARGALIGIERRRFNAAADGIVWTEITVGAPQVSLVDDEQAANGAFVVARMELDLEAETTTYELFG